MSRTKSSAPEAEAMPAETTTEKPRDVVLVNGQTEHGLSVVRLRDERIEVGELRDVREGSPIYGELVKLSPRAEHPRMFDAEVIARGPEAQAQAPAAIVKTPPALPERASGVEHDAGRHKGPPRVTTEAFREGWESVFGARRPKSAPN